ncbi:MAG: hypothetical protein PHH14_02620 [Candidatus Margulisbacteria bacterium]|nr:hypothetical protein [Candidatus Margulisiibacteriota bacterium]
MGKIPGITSNTALKRDSTGLFSLYRINQLSVGLYNALPGGPFASPKTNFNKTVINKYLNLIDDFLLDRNCLTNRKVALKLSFDLAAGRTDQQIVRPAVLSLKIEGLAKEQTEQIGAEIIRRTTVKGNEIFFEPIKQPVEKSPEAELIPEAVPYVSATGLAKRMVRLNLALDEKTGRIMGGQAILSLNLKELIAEDIAYGGPDNFRKHIHNVLFDQIGNIVEIDKLTLMLQINYDDKIHLYDFEQPHGVAATASLAEIAAEIGKEKTDRSALQLLQDYWGDPTLAPGQKPRVVFNSGIKIDNPESVVPEFFTDADGEGLDLPNI